MSHSLYHRTVTLLLLAGCLVLPGCRSKPKKVGTVTLGSPATLEPSDWSVKRSGGRGGKKTGETSEESKPAPVSGKPSIESAPPAALKPPSLPDAPPAPPPVPSVKEKAKAAEAPSVVVPPVVPPAVPRKAPAAAVPPVPPRVSPPQAEVPKVSLPPSPKAVLPPAELPKPAPVVAKKPEAALPASVALPDTSGGKARAGGGALGLVVAPALPGVPPAPLSLRTAAPVVPAGLTNPAAPKVLLREPGTEPRPVALTLRNSPVPTGQAATNAPPAPSRPVPVAPGTNVPPASAVLLKSIGVDPLVPEGKKGATWREQQLAKQAAEQKAREEEQQKLGNALRRFLFKDGGK